MVSMRLFHITSIPWLTVLYPSSPPDDIIDGKFIRAVVDIYGNLPQSSNCISFAGNFENNLKHVLGSLFADPNEIAYVYEPVYEQLCEQPRLIYQEIMPDMKIDPWADFDETIEHRFYYPVAVRIIGEIKWEGVGVTLRITWIDNNRQFLQEWGGIVEVVNGEKISVQQGEFPWSVGFLAKSEEYINLNEPCNRAEVYRVRMGMKKLSDVFDKDYLVRLYRGLWFLREEEIGLLSKPGSFWTPSLDEARSYANVVGLGEGNQQIYYIDLHLSDIVSPKVKILMEDITIWEEGIILPDELQTRSMLL